MLLKTPGYYLAPSAPQPAVPDLEPALPVFFGYTENIRSEAGEDLCLHPIRISSFSEFTRWFGGPFLAAVYKVSVSLEANNQIREVAVNERFFLWDAVNHYFGQGGSACYVVSLGPYAAGMLPPLAPPAGDPCGDLPAVAATPAPEPGQPAPFAAWRTYEGPWPEMASLLPPVWDRLGMLDQPLLLALPDAVRLPDAAFGQLIREVAEVCAQRQEWFLISDVLRKKEVTGDIAAFRNNLSDATGALRYAAAYHPWVVSTHTRRIHLHEIALVDALSGASIQDAGSLGGPALNQRLLEEAQAANADVLHMHTAMAFPSRYVWGLLPGIFREVFAGANEGSGLSDLITLSRRLALAFPTLEKLLSPVMKPQFERISLALQAPVAIQSLISLEKNPLSPGYEEVESAYAALSGTGWLAFQTVGSLTADSSPTLASLLAGWKKAVEALTAALTGVLEVAEQAEYQAEERLYTTHPLFADAVFRLRQECATIPPSGAVAGLYVTTDAAHGVWKAPANAGLAFCLGPEMVLTDREQEYWNVDVTSGKSVNAIRQLTGRATVVWGSRTLEGNSLEWRYVPVRRLFIYVEAYLRRAIHPFLFEANEAGNWVRLRFAVEAFLEGLWKQGALAGTAPAEAFYVAIGLGETMTQSDIMEGRLILEVGLAAVRPAEFIVVRQEGRMEN
jgi:hypothetical protein